EPATEPHVLRRQAFTALIELLARVGSERPVVAWIDDLQWGDLDSAGLLREIARDAPARLLLILGYRSEERDPMLRDIRPAPGDAAMVWDIGLGPLDPEAARTLAGRLAPAPLADVQLDVIAAESR